MPGQHAVGAFAAQRVAGAFQMADAFQRTSSLVPS